MSHDQTLIGAHRQQFRFRVDRMAKLLAADENFVVGGKKAIHMVLTEQW